MCVMRMEYITIPSDLFRVMFLLCIRLPLATPAGAPQLQLLGAITVPLARCLGPLLRAPSHLHALLR